jgi:hypothetical protein
MSVEDRELAKERRERTKRLLSDPNLLDVICGHIANGGTLPSLCETWDVRFGDISNWIHENSERDERYRKALEDRGEWFKETIFNELKGIAVSDIRKLFNQDGSLKAPHEWDEEARRAVAGLEINELFEGSGNDRSQIGLSKKVKFQDRIRALELLGKSVSMFTEKHEVTGSLKLEDLLHKVNGDSDER